MYRHCGNYLDSHVKECPACHEMLHPAIMVCTVCGHSFKTEEEKPAHDAHAGRFLSSHLLYRMKCLQSVFAQARAGFLFTGEDGTGHVRRGSAKSPGNPRPTMARPGRDRPDEPYTVDVEARKAQGRITVRTTPGDPYPRIVDHRFAESAPATPMEDDPDEDPLPF